MNSASMWKKILVLFSIYYFAAAAATAKHQEKNEHSHQVVISLSFGRSGSYFLTELISNIFGVKGMDLGFELFGSNTHELSKKRNHTEFMINYIAHEKQKHKDSPVVGFKWKQGVMNAAYDEAWRYVASQGWLVVHNKRNLLDVFISRSKHGEFFVPSHCTEKSKSCLKKAENSVPYVNVTDALAFVSDATTENARLDYFLRTLNIQLYEVRYEDFAYGSDSMKLKHLQSMADFLLYPSYKKMQMGVLNTQTVATSSSSQADKVTNWREIYDGFKKSSYAYLLRL